MPLDSRPVIDATCPECGAIRVAVCVNCAPYTVNGKIAAAEARGFARGVEAAENAAEAEGDRCEKNALTTEALIALLDAAEEGADEDGAELHASDARHEEVTALKAEVERLRRTCRECGSPMLPVCVQCPPFRVAEARGFARGVEAAAKWLEARGVRLWPERMRLDRDLHNAKEVSDAER